MRSDPYARSSRPPQEESANARGNLLDMSISTDETFGLLFAALAALSFALWNIWMQRGLDRGGSHQAALLTLAASVAGCFLPVVLLQSWTGQLPPLEPRPLAFFALSGLMTSLVAPFHAVHATSRIGAAQTTALRLLDPFFAFAIGLALLGERIGGRVTGGVVLIVVALGLLQRGRRNGPVVATGSHHSTGILFGLGASLFFTVGSVMRKAGLTLLPSALLSSAIEGVTGLIILVSVFLIGRQGHVFREAVRPQSRELWLSGLSGAAGTIFLNLALQRLAVPVAVAVRNTSPWFALVLVPMILGNQHRPGRLIWFSTLLLTGGMTLILAR